MLTKCSPHQLEILFTDVPTVHETIPNISYTMICKNLSVNSWIAGLIRNTQCLDLNYSMCDSNNTSRESVLCTKMLLRCLPWVAYIVYMLCVCVRDTGARATGGQCKNNIYICVNYISEKVTKKLTLSVNELIM